MRALLFVCLSALVCGLVSAAKRGTGIATVMDFSKRSFDEVDYSSNGTSLEKRFYRGTW